MTSKNFRIFVRIEFIEIKEKNIILERMLMIKIKVKVSNALFSSVSSNNSQIEIEDRTTIDELLKQLGFDEEEIQYLMLIVNGSLIQNNYQLEDNDEIFITWPFGGG